MSRGSLSGRLSRIRRMESSRQDTDSLKAELQAGIEGKDATPGEAGTAAATERTLDGWTRIEPFLLERVTDYPVEPDNELSEHLPLFFPREKSVLEQAVPIDVSRFRFFDLETTGLSRGAGTVAFMAGIGLYVDETIFRVIQLVITDYPGETALLERLDAIMGRNSILVSFNGKCFDAQILSNRSLMNGLRAGYLSPETAHLDLLFPSRRLWKKQLGSCRLQVLERNILDFHRMDDLPGSEAPDAWFEYLRGAGEERLQAVGTHNRDDVHTLMRLLRALDASIRHGSGMAGLIRALALRKRGEYLQAAEILESLVQSGLTEAVLLLAIDCEHRLERLERARELARLLGDSYRLSRIERKLALRAARITQNGGQN